MQKPLILDIKCNSLDDGPGIRSVVFFKGCPLSCIWCHNPESKRAYQEISYDTKECIGCGKCREVCPANALSADNRYYIDRDKCNLCFRCADVCPSKAISRVGVEYDDDELLKKLLSDKPFYDVSGGGVTLSGGEATLCTEYVGNLAKKLHENGIKVLLETCGQFDYTMAEQYLLPYLDDIYMDIKLLDREEHKKYCGVYNDTILENFARLYGDKEKYSYSLLPRIPLIPGITDTEENLTAIADFMKKTGVIKTDLLPYNPTWYSKNEKIGVELNEVLEGKDSWQSRETIDRIKEIFKTRNIEC